MKKVFISSTSLDLKDYRQAASDVSLRLDMFPINMEQFGAMDAGATEGSKRKLRDADLYVGIYAHRYGYIEAGYNRSVTEIEFDYAGELGLPRLCFVVNPDYPWPETGRDPKNHKKLLAFKSKVDRSRIRETFTTVDDFRAKLMQALVNYRDHPEKLTDEPGQTKQWQTFIHSRWLVFVLPAVLLTIGLAAILLPQIFPSLSPAPTSMQGDFNIAVAQFVDQSLTKIEGRAELVTQRVFDTLDREYDSTNFGLKIELRNLDRTIESSQEAETLAQSVGADIIIFGSVVADDGSGILEVSPRFYISPAFRINVEELTGEHGLDLPIASNDFTELLRADSPLNRSLQSRSIIISQFTLCLAYLEASQLALAGEAIGTAIEEAEKSNDLPVPGVLYLFASNIARHNRDYEQAQVFIEQALAPDPHYGRALILKGNIYYDQGVLYLGEDYVTTQEYFSTASSMYRQALELENQPYKSFIAEKANTGIGQLNTIQYIYNPIATAENRTEFAQTAIEYFEKVIDSYDRNSEPFLREFAANAHYWSGVIYQSAGRLDEAEAAFESTLELTQNPDFISDSQKRLTEISAQLSPEGDS